MRHALRAQGVNSALNLPGCVSIKVMDFGLFWLQVSEVSEHTSTQNQSHIVPSLHLGVSLDPVCWIWVFITYNVAKHLIIVYLWVYFQVIDNTNPFNNGPNCHH